MGSGTFTNIRNEIYDELKNLEIPPDKTFGKALLPIMVRSNYENGDWSDLEVYLTVKIKYQLLLLQRNMFKVFSKV